MRLLTRIRPRSAFALTVCASLALGGCSGIGHSGEAPDLVLHNGLIWTADQTLPQAQAVAIAGERFAAVGDNADILAMAGPETRVIDLDGGFAVPGFIDTHVHFGSAARFLEFNIMRVGSQEEFAERVRETVQTLPEGEWILGGYWGAYDQWTAGSAGGNSRSPFVPDMRAVEPLAPSHPIFIRKYDDSEFAANRAALKAAQLDPDNPKADGVEFARDEKGPTGVLRGPGVAKLFENVIPRDFSRERRIEQSRKALEEIRRRGVTGISDMSDDLQLEIYRELRERGELTVRVDFRYALDRWRELDEKGISRGSGDEWIRLGGLKGHIDGIMGTSTARFLQPYENDPANRGRWRRLMVDEKGEFVEGKFLQYLLEADKANLQLTVHAIGDEANRLLLDYCDELVRQNGAKDRRFRLVHAQVIAPEDFSRLGQLGIVAEVQPFHLSDDMRWMEERIGASRSGGAYAFRSIADSGSKLCFGSDWPGTSASEYPINPMLGLYAAVSRQTLSGQPPEGWFPDQRLTIEEALKAYTADAAYASFEENLKGTVSTGKLADLAVLNRNLLQVSPEEILQAEVVYTIIGGRIVYSRAEDGSK